MESSNADNNPFSMVGFGGGGGDGGAGLGGSPSSTNPFSQLMGHGEITPLTGLVNPSSMMGMAITFLLLGTIFTVVRFVTRRMQRIIIGWDDWLILPALLLMLGMCFNMIAAVAMKRFGYKLPPRVNGLGMPDPNGYAPEVAQENMFEFAQELMAPLQLMCTKLSIVLFYRRILVGVKRGFFHWATLIVLVAIGLWGVVLATAFAFPCGTRWYLYWNGPPQEGAEVCITQQLELSLVITDVILDIIILILPIPKIFRLQMSLRKKLLVCVAFVVGSLTVVTAFVRADMMVRLLRETDQGGAGGRPAEEPGLVSADESTQISYAVYWGMLESGMSVVVACLPALQYLVTRSGPIQLVRTVTDGIRSVSQLSFRRHYAAGSSAGSRTRGTANTTTTTSSSSSSSSSPSSGDIEKGEIRLAGPAEPGFAARSPRSYHSPLGGSSRSDSIDRIDGFDIDRRTRQMDMF